MKSYFTYPIISLLFFLCANVFKLSAQNPEYLYAHFDKEFYVAGEDVWFSIHFLAPSEQKSQVLYVELFSPEGEEVIHHTLKVENNQAVGDFVLPADLTEAYYTFRAYTKWNLSFSPQVIFQHQIPVYNPVREIRVLPKLDVAKVYNPLSTDNIDLKLNQAIYEPRELVKLTLKSANQELAHVSVSVTDLKYTDANSSRMLPAYLEQLSKQETPELNELLEAESSLNRVFYLKDPESKEVVNSNFIMGFVKLNHQKLIRTAADGVVDFPLNNFYDTTVIQIFDANPFLPTYIPLITPISEELPVSSPVLSQEVPPLTEAVKHYLLEYQHRFQLSKLFGNMDLIRAKSEKVIPSQFTPTSVYEVDNFIDLGSLESFFKQAIPPVTVKNSKYRKGKYIPPRLKLYVPHKQPYRNIKVIKNKPTLLLVNEYFTYDTDAVLGMRWNNIERVEVYNTVQNLAQQFGPLGEFGVISITTRDGKTPPSITETGNNLKVAGFYRPRLLTTINYELGAHRNSKIPDFRPTIYWNPQIPLAPGAETEIQFPAGDQFGKYLIRVEGVLQNGSPISTEAVFELRY